MDRYNIICPLGENSMFIVMKAEHIKTKEIVSIKKLKKKYYCWSDTMELKEIKVLRVAQSSFQ